MGPRAHTTRTLNCLVLLIALIATAACAERGPTADPGTDLLAHSQSWQRCLRLAERPAYLRDRAEDGWGIYRFGHNADNRFDTWGWLRISLKEQRVEVWSAEADAYIDDDLRTANPSTDPKQHPPDTK